MLAGIIILAGVIIYSFYFSWIRIRIRKPAQIPVSVNYHFTRKVSISSK